MADPDLDVTDAAVLLLSSERIEREAATSPIPREAEE
jgi:hypothetical protein